MATTPTRIDAELFEAAKAAGRGHGRSAVRQLDHWVRVGRELEASPTVTHHAVERVLTGRASYDDVDDGVQAIVRACWDRGIGQRISGLDFSNRAYVRPPDR